MNSVSSNRIVIFSKSADPDSVKTRMRPKLSKEECLSLHLSLLKDAIEKVKGFSSVLYLAGSGYLPFEPHIPVKRQEGRDLGERMKNAFASELKEFTRVVIIGTDAPTVPVTEILRALDLLTTRDAVFGPAEDGGYYLIGLRNLLPQLFSGIEWGAETVLRKSLEKLLPQNYALLDRYFDIDLPQDLIRLKEDLGQAKDVRLTHIRDWLNSYGCGSAM